jgi:polysaccharide export outer membrane protein
MTSTILAAALAFAASIAQAAAPTAVQGTVAGQPEYQVGPQDVLAVTVQGVAELTRDVTIDQEGMFDFPLIGRVTAGGKGVRAIADDIKGKLSPKYLVNPVVNVEVKTFRSQNVYVFGEVSRAGMFKIEGNANLMAVLAEAGFNSKSGSTITITRWPKGTKPTGGSAANAPNAEVIKVSRKDLEYGRAQSILLQDGDTITVPEADKFTIQGEVRTTGIFDLDGEITLLQALAIAGGVTDKAAKNRIEIIRQGVEKPLKNVKMTEIIKADDIITVPKRRW